MKHAVILAHPDPKSLCAQIAAAYAKSARALGHKAAVRDLYARRFDPRLPVSELPWNAAYAPGADLMAERKAMADVDVFVLVYPLWFNAPPAILKGWVDRVFSLGFGFRPAEGGGNAPSLTGRRLLSFSTSGAPDHWVNQTGALEHLRKGFDDHVAGVCGLTVAGHANFGGIVPGIRRDAVAEILEAVRGQAAALFGQGGSAL